MRRRLNNKTSNDLYWNKKMGYYINTFSYIEATEAGNPITWQRTNPPLFKKRTLFLRSCKLVPKFIKAKDKSIRQKIISYFAPLVAISILSSSVLCFYNFYIYVKREKINSTISLVNQTETNVNYYFSDVKTIMAYFSGNATIINALQNYNSLSIQQQYEINQSISQITQNINIYKDYISDVLILGKSGYQTNLSNSHILGNQKVMYQAWFQPYLNVKGPGFYYAPVHPNAYYGNVVLGTSVVSIILPVRNYDNDVIGYIVGDLNLDILNTLTAYNMDLILSDTDGTIMYDKDTGEINKKINPNILNSIKSSTIKSVTFVDGNRKYLAIGERMNNTDWLLYFTVPYSTFYSPIYKISKIEFFIILPMFLIAAIIMTIVLSSQIKKPLDKLIKRMDKMDIEKYVYIKSNYRISEVNILGNKFEKMLSQISRLINEVYSFRMMQKEAELQSLREQITPHFMYNALQLIKSEAIVSKNRNISRIVTSLGNLLHYSMDNNKSVVLVKDEIDYTIDFLKIFQYRFGNNLDYTINIDQNIYEFKIPKFILQPLVENCIKHGLKDRLENSLITITGYLDNDSLLFIVRDNGCGIDEKTIEYIMNGLSFKGNSNEIGIGLMNIHKRIVLKNGRGFGIIKIESKQNEYTEITLRIRAEK